MNRNMDYYSRGIANAFARRKAQQPKQSIQTTQKVCSDASNILATTNIVVKLSDEQYRTTVIQRMITLIHNKRKTA